MNRRLKVNVNDLAGNSNRPAAAALQYDPTQTGAPKVVAVGRGKVAEHILELARQNHIPVYADPTLCSLLAVVNLGDEIPPELYQVVAQVLAYIYRVAHSAG
jgi:flagellar biosynthesis protein